jgi:hypothetical protein
MHSIESKVSVFPVRVDLGAKARVGDDHSALETTSMPSRNWRAGRAGDRRRGHCGERHSSELPTTARNSAAIRARRRRPPALHRRAAGRRGKVEKLFTAEERRLVRHPRHGDDCVGVEIVTVVVSPTPEIARPAIPMAEPEDPPDEQPSSAEQWTSTPANQPGNDPRHVAELWDRRRLDGSLPM